MKKWHKFTCSTCKTEQVFLSDHAAFEEGWRGVEVTEYLHGPIITAYACRDCRPK